MPLVSRTFDQLISFTRTSAATYVNSAGNVVTTPASKNLLTFTEEFDNAAWATINATVTANSVAAPDGLMTADKIVEDATNNIHRVNATYTFPNTNPHTLSVYAKAGERFWLRVNNGSDNLNAWFNLSSGSVGTVSVGVTATITPDVDGWYRCAITFSPASAAAKSMAFNVSNADAVSTYTGDGTSGLYLYGAQLETGSTATSYVRNFGGLFPPRFDYDPVTLQPRGLLIEEQRTNLLLRSEEFDNAEWTKSESTVTANAATSPDGTADAEKLIPNAASISGRVVQTFTGSVGATYTLSVYAKQAEFTNCRLYSDDNGSSSASVSYNLSTGAVSTAAAVSGPWTGVSSTITAAGNGWWRITLTWTATSVAPARVAYWCRDTGDGTSGIFLWGAQLEAGSFATSYIPTAGSQVTRTADQASIVAPNFSQWYNQSEGTLLVEAVPYLVTGNGGFASLNGGSWADRMDTRRDGYALVTSGGVSQASLSVAGMTANQVNKLALAYKVNDFALVLNGGTPATDTSGTVPTVSLLQLGGLDNANAFNLNGRIRRITYYPSRLSNAQLQALSA